jgi:hypothetical protein
MMLTAIMPARNESWVLGLSARAALMYCDNLVILDHASEDETVAIVAALMEENPGRIHLISEPDPAWNEMNHRQRLLEYARGLGATHIAPVDADEILAGDMLPTIRDHIQALKPGHFLSTKMRNLHRSIGEYRSDDSPFGSMAGTMLAFADSPHLSWAPKNGYQHHQRSPIGSKQGPMLPGSGIMHLQFASWRRLVAKHKAYRIREKLSYPEKSTAQIEEMYSLATDESGLELAPVPAPWWLPYEGLMCHLDLDQVPWQEAYVEDQIDRHGLARFNGLKVA